MTPAEPPVAVELIPARRQPLWGAPAVANFVLGGLGGGVYVAAAVAAGLLASPALTLASWLGPLLVLAGFAAVACEAGRPWRGPRVLARVATSWMSRELWLGGAFAALAAVEFVAPASGARLLALVAALGLVTAQGFILRRARGVAAWSVGAMPVLFLVSALLSGLGLLLLVEGLAGRPPGGALLGVTLGLLPFGLLAWLAYVTWSTEPAFAGATRPLREGTAAAAAVGAGYVAPFVLAGAALALPDGLGWASPLAGLLMIAGQAAAKWLVIVEAGQLRPITLANLRIHRRTA